MSAKIIMKDKMSNSIKPRTLCYDLSDIPINPSVLDGPSKPSERRFFRSSSSEFKALPANLPVSTQSSEANTIDKETEIEAIKASFRIRPATPKINLLKNEREKDKGLMQVVDIFGNFEELVRAMIEKGEDIESESDLYLKILSDYFHVEKDVVKSYKKIEIMADTSNLTLQGFGEALPELLELKLAGSIIHSLRDVGTSFKSLKILWISRVGLKDLAGN